MRKVLLLLSLVLVAILRAQSTQTLWAVTPYGGAYADGTMLKMNTDGTGLVKVADLSMCISEEANGYLIQASNGLLYGTSFWGGCAHSCNIFSCDPVTGLCADVYEFQVPSGYEPYGGLAEMNNILYGTTWNGGLNGRGVFYSFDLTNGTYTDIEDFNGQNGDSPRQSPVAFNGKIYGLTPQGGASGLGVIYCYNPADSSFNVVHDFSQSEGGGAWAPLTIGSDGKLYGLTTGGGANNQGALFSFDVNSGICTNLYSFDLVTGAIPYCSPTEVANGIFCGTTSIGGSDSSGVIFRYNTLNGNYQVLHNFTSLEGQYGMCTLCLSPNGQLFGVAANGTSNPTGIIYSIDPVNGIFNTLYNLNNFLGTCPQGGFIIVTSPQSVHETEVQEIDFSVFPSPAHDLIKITSSLTGSTTFTIINTLGQSVQQWNDEVVSNYYKVIDVSVLESGVYFIKMQNGSEVVSKKFVKE